MIGKRAENAINRAVQHAIDSHHEYFTLEHILWSLLDESDVLETLQACGGNPEVLKTELETYLRKEIPKMKEENAASSGEQPVATLSVQRLIQRALFHVQSAGKDEIRPIDLLVAIFQAKDSQALYLLKKQGVERLEVIQYLSHGLQSQDFQTSEGEASMGGGVPSSGGAPDPLKEYTENLNEKAKKGKIDPLLGRENEIQRMIQTLCRRRKNNPLLVGEAGVGKTALAEGLALKIVSQEVPDLLSSAVIYSLDMGQLIAGAKFRGDFEQRLKRVLQAIQKKKEKGELPILFIDEIHTIIGAGSVSDGALDAANLLKPMLSQGEIRCLGSTTYTEYRNVFEKDHALARRFQKIDVVEPTNEETLKILQGLKGHFEDYHEVIYTPEALSAAVELSQKHITDRFLPDKAIDVIDEAGARARLKKGLKEGSKEGGRTSITQGSIEEVISQIARIPPRSVSTSQKDRLQTLDRDLKLSIFGQDHAIEALVTSIRLARSGLRTGERPVGSFLMCGPTGVGKTELAKQLALALGVPFLRFDMSEYSEKHTVSRLIGAPPGYVGFDQQGLLTGEVLKQPHSVILLDEIEKAHFEIWNILLQIMDHGTLTDNNGRKVGFKNTILLMTSNVGSRDIEKREIGLGSTFFAKDGKAASKAVEQTFSPEFRNRLDAILYFNPLSALTISHVVDKNLVELESQLLAKEVEIEFTSELREWLAQKGYNTLLGARPMQRLIQDEIKKPLSEQILFGELQEGGWVKVSLKENRPHFEWKKKEVSVKPNLKLNPKSPKKKASSPQEA